jgi:hypothetical protein
MQIGSALLVSLGVRMTMGMGRGGAEGAEERGGDGEWKVESGEQRTENGER